MTIYIIDPRNGRLCTIEEWRKEPDPTIAELVCIDGCISVSPIAMHKYIFRDENEIPEDFTWENAKEAVRKFRIYTKFPGNDVASFHLPTRHQCIDIYDARFCGLDEALELIGGDPIEDGLIWTDAEEINPEYAPYRAFLFSCSDGNIFDDDKTYMHRVRPVVDPFLL